jgi:hypothetical protein
MFLQCTSIYLHTIYVLTYTQCSNTIHETNSKFSNVLFKIHSEYLDEYFNEEGLTSISTYQS